MTTELNGLKIVGAHIVPNSVGYKPDRVESNAPCSVRFAEYPDGRRVLQGCYQWNHGLDSGFVWKDIKCVKVDESGSEIT